MKKMRLLLIEDNRILREGLATMLRNLPDIEVVGAFGKSDDIVNHAREHEAPVVVLGASLRNPDSPRAVELLKNDLPDVKVIVMDLFPLETDLPSFIRAGVSGFVTNDATFEDLLTTIRAVIRGEKVLPTAMTTVLFSQIAENPVSPGDSKHFQSVRMTGREQQITQMIAEGLSNKEIATRLNLSPYTVKSHVHNILEKLACHSRLQVVKYADTQRASSSNQ